MSAKPAAKFYITRHDPSNNASGVMTSLALRGAPLGADPANEANFVIANADNFIGFLTRDMRTAAGTPTDGNIGGITLEDIELGRTSDTPVGLELPFVVGQEVSVQKAREIEVEGPNYIMLSGSGAISAGTTVPQKMTLDVTGRWRITQSSETVNGTLTANNLPAVDDGLSDLRIRIEVKQ